MALDLAQLFRAVEQAPPVQAAEVEVLQVANARDHGWPWQQIAEALGVSKQAVHKKHAPSRLRRR